MIKKWYVYGTGGFGVETMDILLDMLANSDNAGFECEFLEDKPECKVKFGFLLRVF